MREAVTGGDGADIIVDWSTMIKGRHSNEDGVHTGEPGRRLRGIDALRRREAIEWILTVRLVTASYLLPSGRRLYGRLVVDDFVTE